MVHGEEIVPINKAARSKIDKQFHLNEVYTNAGPDFNSCEHGIKNGKYCRFCWTATIERSLLANDRFIGFKISRKPHD